MLKVVATDKAPKAIGPYSQAIQAGDFLFASGQVHIDPATGELAGGNIEEQAKRALDNVKNLVEAAGFTMSQVVKTTVFIAEMKDFAAINGVYAKYFGENPPARSCVAVKELPKGAKIEVEVVAYKG